MTHLEFQEAQLRGAGQVGKVLLIGSGETSASAHEMYQQVFETLPRPVRVAILETPAGFELNSALVAQKVADFLKISMRNFSPEIHVIPARRKEGSYSTGDASILGPMLKSNFLYLGAGSPTYAVGSLDNSLAFKYLLRQHLLGATICLASAGAISFGSKTLPVYEIYKAGHELRWTDGLDFFGRFGLDLAIVTHWNNQEGGRQLDTSRCFMGRSRMAQLIKLLPPRTRVLGIDEHTGLILDFHTGQCKVVGKGGVMVVSRRNHEAYDSGAVFAIEALGSYRLPAEVLQSSMSVQSSAETEAVKIEVPEVVAALVDKREKLRQKHDWSRADSVRREIASLGFDVRDTKAGPILRPNAAVSKFESSPADRASTPDEV